MYFRLVVVRYNCERRQLYENKIGTMWQERFITFQRKYLPLLTREILVENLLNKTLPHCSPNYNFCTKKSFRYIMLNETYQNFKQSKLIEK